MSAKVGVSPTQLCFATFFLSFIASWCLGGAQVFPWELLSQVKERELSQYILLQIRLPRMIAACIVGACLGVAGTLTQGVFRNSLASPSVLGISSGGTLCVILAYYWQWSETAPWIVAPLAFFGCISTLFLILRFVRTSRTSSTETILLFGFSLSSIFGSLTTLFLSFSLGQGQKAFSLMNWLLGTLAGKTWYDCLWVLPTCLAGILLAFRLCYPLNLFSLGEDQANSLGLNIRSFRTKTLLSISLLVASSVALGGMFPFVGLLVPHLTRLLIGPDHRKLIPISLLNGMSLILLTDLFARTVVAPIELQVGVIVSLIGSPFFLWLLAVKRQERDIQ